MLNQLLGGHYLVIQSLGEGGLAKTYIAKDHHRPGHPKCAVKYLKPASNDPAFLPIARRLFNKEAEILEKIGQHDQIPRLLAYFEQNKEFYLVQEFIEGHTLSAELPPGHRWSENKVIQMLQDVLQILQFVHSYRVIHRDIKPTNLIRRQKDGRLVLIDFGAVKQIRDPSMMANAPLTQKTISIGTQGYIPTEQVRGKPRLNSDIYALGMIGIQALTGIHPFNLQEDADGEIIWQNRAEVSDKLAAILNKMVRYHFKERYQSATEVLRALEALAHYNTLIPSTSGTKQSTPELASKSEMPETKVSLDFKHQDVEAVPNSKPWETKVALDLKQLTPELASEKKEKRSRVSSADSLTPSKNFELSRANISVYLNKYRLLIGAGTMFVVVGMAVGYTSIKKRQSYLQAQKALEKIESLRADEEYHKCISKAEIFPRDHSVLHTEAWTLLHDCQQHEAAQFDKARRRAAQLDEARRQAAQSISKSTIAKNDQQVDLKSDKGIDYTQLRNYLEAQRWREADEETHRVMLEATKENNLTQESIKNFPCNDLKTINSLWQHYSSGRFGFNIQNKEYQNVKKSINPLGNKLGWRQENWMTYNYLWKNFNLDLAPNL